ncbi:MAG: DUF2752 domain-containing protein [Candidatus Aminicenantaceae bacterium]
MISDPEPSPRAGLRVLSLDRRQMPHLVVLLICTAIIAAALMLSPAGPAGRHLHLFSFQIPPTCSFLDLTGLPCPGCGLTRSVVATVHGDLAGSWGFHRLGALTVLYILIQAVFRIGVLAFPLGTAAIFGTGAWLNRGIIVLAVLYGINWLISLALLL